jgi:hypothetical protein
MPFVKNKPTNRYQHFLCLSGFHVKDEDINNRWQEYFDKSFNEDSESSSIELDISSDDLNSQFMHSIQESEVKMS